MRALPELDDLALWEDFARNSASYYAQLDRLDRELGAASTTATAACRRSWCARWSSSRSMWTDLKATLRTYQEFGVRYILRQGNVLLGDEMGLGKTVQAIAAMVSLKALGATHFMVVCPASVLVNWCREIKQFSDLPVTLIKGGDFMASRRWIEEGGVAVTTYESISRFALPEDFPLRPAGRGRGALCQKPGGPPYTGAAAVWTARRSARCS